MCSTLTPSPLRATLSLSTLPSLFTLRPLYSLSTLPSLFTLRPLYSLFALRPLRSGWPLRKFDLSYLVAYCLSQLRSQLRRLGLYHSTYFFVARPASKSCAGREEYYERKSNEEFH